MEQELNKKLAEWLGWKQVDTLVSRSQGTETNTVMGVVGTQIINSVYFTQSLDACFKWLVPKLVSIELHTWTCEPFGSQATVFPNDAEVEQGWANTPALALCLAIEKLIGRKE